MAERSRRAVREIKKPSPVVRAWWSLYIVAFAGCSGGAEQSGSSADVKATSQAPVADDDGCKLLTKTEAGAALRSPIAKKGRETAPEPMGTMLRGSCFYRSEDGGTVELTVDTYPDQGAATTRFERLRRLYRGGHDIAGVGENAFAHDKVLVTQRGNVHVMVNLDPEGANKIVNFSDTKAMDALYAIERGIASRALERLPSSGQAVSAVAGEKSACSMIEKDEMEGILGGPLSFAVPTDSPDRTVCTYTGTRRYAQVTVEWAGGESGIEGAELAGALMNSGKAGEVKASNRIEGLGDEAVMMFGGILNVRKGKALLTIDLRMQKDYERKATAIAEKVLSKM